MQPETAEKILKLLGILQFNDHPLVHYAWDKHVTPFPNNWVDMKKHQLQFQDRQSNSAVSSLTAQDIVEEMYMGGQLDNKEYKSALKTIREIEKQNGTTLGINDKDLVLLRNAFSDKKTKNTIGLYDKLASTVSTMKMTNYEDIVKELQNGLAGNAPQTGPVAAPNYLDVNFKGYQRNVDPVKLWTGQELADLHSLDFNPDNYYDLIKKGTSAAVDLANYTSDQMNQASMVNDSKNLVSYLDNIRNNKANAVSKGATLGAKRAGELLNNVQNLSNYARSQAENTATRYDTVGDKLLADSQAQLKARNYFDQLARTLSQDSALLYANDSERYFQDQRYNGDLYAADQALRGARLDANSQMYGSYLTNNANIAGANAGARADNDEYAWVLNNALRVHNNDAAKAVHDVNNYLYRLYTNKDPIDYMIDAAYKK